MNNLVLSQNSLDAPFASDVRQTLGDLVQEVWIDSRELRGGDPLWPEIRRGISVCRRGQKKCQRRS